VLPILKHVIDPLTIPFARFYVLLQDQHGRIDRVCGSWARVSTIMQHPIPPLRLYSLVCGFS
jgi:hypothetical protein